MNYIFSYMLAQVHSQFFDILYFNNILHSKIQHQFICVLFCYPCHFIIVLSLFLFFIRSVCVAVLVLESIMKLSGDNYLLAHKGHNFTVLNSSPKVKTFMSSKIISSLIVACAPPLIASMIAKTKSILSIFPVIILCC